MKKKNEIIAFLRPLFCRFIAQPKKSFLLPLVFFALCVFFFFGLTKTTVKHVPVPLPPLVSPILHLSASTVEYLQRHKDPNVTLCCIGAQGSQVCYPKGGKSGNAYRILFHSNSFGLRGTEVAMFDYMTAFEQHACGIAYAAASSDTKSLESKGKFEASFPNRTLMIKADGVSNDASALTIKDAILKHSISAVYTIQASSKAPWKVHKAKLLVHGVFDGFEKEKLEGTSIATISEAVPRTEHVPVVPHIVYLNASHASTPGLRDTLGISPSARVFCRHGGLETFQIDFARQALCTHAINNPEDIFLLLNTNALPCENGLNNIKHLPGNSDLLYKRRFLNTCNACVHGRKDGETFGLSVAECSSVGLPVITYAHPPPEADYHLRVLGQHALTYKDSTSLLAVLQGFDTSLHGSIFRRNLYTHLYDRYKPESVILEFLEKFDILEDVIMGQ